MQELALQYPNEVEESVYSVEDVASDSYMEQSTYISEDDGPLPGQLLFQGGTFPLLEVDEISLDNLKTWNINT